MKMFRIVNKWIKIVLQHIYHLLRKKDIYDLVPSLKRVNSEKIFSGIQPGDIIIATTFQTYDELKEVAEGHRLRPMIVAKKDDEYAYAFSGSSKNKHYRIMFVMDGKVYGVARNCSNKTSYVNLGRINTVPKNNISQKAGRLSLMDQLKINDIIWNKTHNNNMLYIQRDYPFQTGQIVRKENKLYYLSDINGNKGTVYDMVSNSSVDENLNENHFFTQIQIPFGKQVYTLSLKKHEEYLKDLIPTSVIEKGIKNRLKTIEKPKKPSVHKKWDRYTNHYFRYDSGQIFLLGSLKYIYLFSNSGEDYGVRKYDAEEIYDYLNLERLKRLDEYFHPSGKLRDDELYETVQELIFYHEKYEWLLNELFVVE